MTATKVDYHQREPSLKVMRTCGSKGQRKYIENITIRLDARKARKGPRKATRKEFPEKEKRTAIEKNFNLNVSCEDIKLQIHSERGSENIALVVA